MPKTSISEEVQILRFFESAQLEKAEMLFNIVREKMRARSPAHPPQHGKVLKKKEPLPVSSAGKDDGDYGGSP